MSCSILWHKHCGHPALVLFPFPYGVDDTLSDAVDVALGRAAATRMKAKPLLERFLSACLATCPAGIVDLDEPSGAAARRFRTFLTDNMGCQVQPASGRYDGSYEVTRPDASSQTISLLIPSVRRLYDTLIDNDGYHDENPLAIDGWRDAAADRVRERLSGGRGAEERWRTEAGNRFRIADRAWSPPVLDDLEGLSQTLVDEARRRNWPATNLNLLLAIRDDAMRSGDIRVATAGDWARGSCFGRVLSLPGKGSEDRRVKDAVITDETRHALADAIDAHHRADPSKPSMDDLRCWHDTNRWAELDAVPLFPSCRGTAISYSGFYQRYRRLVDDAGIVVHGPEGTRRPTPHLGRHEGVGREVTDIITTIEAGPERDRAMQTLNHRKGWKSMQVHRYAAGPLRNEDLAIRIADQDRLNALKGATPPIWSTLPTNSPAARATAHWPD